MYKWYLPTLSEILALSGAAATASLPNLSLAQHQVRAEREWSGAIAALNQLLGAQRTAELAASTPTPTGTTSATVQGVLLSGPFPVLDDPKVMAQLATWAFTVTSGEIALQLSASHPSPSCSDNPTTPTLPLLPDDPLATEQFCLVLTPELSMVMVMGETAGQPAFLFSFDPEVVWQAWRSLQARLMLTSLQALNAVNGLVEQFRPAAPDYRTVMQFSRLTLAHLPEPDWDTPQRRVQSLPLRPHRTEGIAAQFMAQHTVAPSVSVMGQSCHASKPNRLRDTSAVETGSDTELLQAIAHEVRTPLSTIRTLTRLLLRRKDLNPDVVKRLEVIDRECTEQIDRFSLIFKAVELETAKTNPSRSCFAPISLTTVVQQNMGRWQEQASQHSHTLDITLPQKLPMVVTDPTMLDQALTGLIDRLIHSLPPSSHIQGRVILAGHQLKLQLEAQPPTKGDNKAKIGFAPALKSLGQLLMFQPETGNLSLNMAVTKNLFHALGGKLIVRQRPQQGEVLTIFLPLASRKAEE